MSDIQDTTSDKPKRSLAQEFLRMEDDFDLTRSHRLAIANRILETAQGLKLVDTDGQLNGAIEDNVKFFNLALKTLEGVEKANGFAISHKLRQKEQDVASAAAARERIQVVIQASRPGTITDDSASAKIERLLDEQFNEDIKDFELKTSPRDLSDE
jgi:hypothetical protein